MHQSALVLIAAISAASALKLAGSVFAPIALALFIIAIFWPMQRELQRRMPRLLALAVTTVLMVAVVVAFGSLIAWAFTRVIRSVVADASQLQALYDQAADWLEARGIAIAGVWAEHFNVGWMIRRAQGITGRINSTLSFWLVVFVYVILGLLEVEDFERRARAIRDPEIAYGIANGSKTTALKIRRYMVVRTQMSLVTGLLVWLFAKVIGLQFAEEWGVIAFALNYIPFLGPFFATFFPTVFAIAQFQSWQAVLGVFAVLNAIQFIVGSYVEPRVSGNALSISPTVILLAIFFWTYIWGLFGTFIGVPITIALLTFAAQYPASRWLAELLGMDDEPLPPTVKG
ncbi:MAG: AI-2E family transporter [Rhizobiaceae bacterium]|nr:AI-2E family transporter [Rhizobiaceae bacterium]